jgi:hypothetical protein
VRLDISTYLTFFMIQSTAFNTEKKKSFPKEIDETGAGPTYILAALFTG